MNLLLVTNAFPSPLMPAKGPFNLELVRALTGAGHRVRVVCPIAWTDEWSARRRGGSLPPGRRAEVAGATVLYPRYYFTPKVMRERYGWFMWRSVAGVVRDQLAAARPDAVVGYWAHPDGEAAVRAARLAGVPSAVIVGGSDVLLLTRVRGRRQCILDVLRAADAVVPVSEDLRAKLVEFGIAPGKLHVVARGVDGGRFNPGDRAAARRRLGIAADGPVVVWVGRMVPVKGLDVLVRAVAELRSAGVAFHLYLVGDGPLRNDLRAQADALGVGKMITFVGIVAHDNLPDWYRAADLTVLPSRSEGVPNALRESLACGTPFVASRVGGIPEIAGMTRCKLVPPDDAAALAEAIREAFNWSLTDGHKRVSPQPSWDDSAAALTDVIRRLIRKVSRSRPGTAPRLGELATMADPTNQLLRAGMAAVLPRRRFIVNGPRRATTVCLTFDDGPHPEHTSRLLDVLKGEGVRATFFMIGREMERHPEVVRRIVADGHAVGGHSYSHGEPRATSARELAAEVERSQRVLERITGRRTRLFRPPYGKLTAGKLWRLWGAGQRVVLWNVDPKDFACRSTAELAERWDGSALRGGDVVLLHDNVPFAAEVLPAVVRSARRGGIEFGTVADWVGRAGE